MISIFTAQCARRSQDLFLDLIQSLLLLIVSKHLLPSSYETERPWDRRDLSSWIQFNVRTSVKIKVERSIRRTVLRTVENIIQNVFQLRSRYLAQSSRLKYPTFICIKHFIWFSWFFRWIQLNLILLDLCTQYNLEVNVHMFSHRFFRSSQIVKKLSYAAPYLRCQFVLKYPSQRSLRRPWPCFSSQSFNRKSITFSRWIKLKRIA